MPSPTNPEIAHTSEGSAYGLGGQIWSPSADFIYACDLLPSFAGVFWDVLTNTYANELNAASATEDTSTLLSRDSRNGNLFSDGVNQTTCYVTPGATSVPQLQYQINGGTQYTGPYTGPDPVAFVAWDDYQTLEVTAMVGGNLVVTNLSLTTNSVVGNVIYSKAGATDYYKDYGGNYWYKTGGVWGSDAVSDASIIAGFNEYFGVIPAGGYIAYYVLTEGTFLVVVNGNTASDYTLIQDGTTTVFPPASLAVNGIPFYNAGFPFISPETGFGNGQLNFDGSNYATLTTNIVNYGIGSGPPPVPPEWTPPTPVPPYVPPDPGRIIPPKIAQTYGLTNIAHETSGNY